jgi:hypothetical protein
MFFLITALYSNIVLKDSFNIEDCTKIVAYLDSKYYYRGKKNLSGRKRWLLLKENCKTADCQKKNFLVLFQTEIILFLVEIAHESFNTNSMFSVLPLFCVTNQSSSNIKYFLFFGYLLICF